MKSITVEEIEGVLHAPLSPTLREQWHETDLRYEELTEEERDKYLLEVVKLLLHDDTYVAGEYRLPEWEAGWGNNLTRFEDRQISSLIPRYYGKHEFVRWKQRIVHPVKPYFDYRIHCLLVDWAIETYLSQVDAIYDFGCGPAYHLLRARRYNPKARLVGLDWTRASQAIISAIVDSKLDDNIEGRYFDFYHPDYAWYFIPNNGVLTVAALEQIGDKFEPFLQFLLAKRPRICVHIEPIEELMDQNNLIDSLSIWYCRKRNYLRGFLTRLRQLQDQGKVDILLEQRTYSGSFFIEGHSLVVWSPKGIN